MTDITHIEQIITRALLEGCDNHKTRAQIARETARRVMEVVAAPAGWKLVPVVMTDEMTDAARSALDLGEGYVETSCLDLDAAYEAAITAAPDGKVEPVPSYADGLKEGLRRAARKATSFLVGDPTNGVPLRNPMAHEVAAAILSLLTKEEGR